MLDIEPKAVFHDALLLYLLIIVHEFYVTSKIARARTSLFQTKNPRKNWN
jgi:hypothetical protein